MVQTWREKLKATNPSPNVKTPRKKSQFYTDLWPALENRGWKLELGNRAQDRYFLPPGVNRGPPFQNRKDFFDSAKQVINCVLKDGKWKSDAVLQKIVTGLENKVPSAPIATTPKASGTRAKRVTRQTREQPAKKTKPAPQDKPDEKVEKGSKLPKQTLLCGEVLGKKPAENGPKSMKADETRICNATAAEKSGKNTEGDVLDVNMPDATTEMHATSIKPMNLNKKFKLNKDQFLSNLWPKLEKLGWRKERGKGNKEFYFVPPGVQRIPPFKMKRDYFDSVSQCYNAIKNDLRWCLHSGLKAAVLKFESDGQNQIDVPIPDIEEQLFNHVVFQELKKFGWKKIVENNITKYKLDTSDEHFIYSEVLKLIRENNEWKANAQIEDCLLLYDGSLSLWDELKNSSEQPDTNNEQKLVKWIVTEYQLRTVGLYV